MSVIARTFRCPNLVTVSDEMMVEEALESCPGIETVETDHTVHTVFIAVATQEGMLGAEEILRDSGYPPQT